MPILRTALIQFKKLYFILKMKHNMSYLQLKLPIFVFNTKEYKI